MRITNILLQGISFSTITVAFFGLSSCRTSDTENNLTQGTKAQVNINFMGTVFKDEGLTPQASLKSMSAGNQKEQSHTVMLTPSSVLTATLSPVKSGSSAQAGLKTSMAVVSGNPLNNGAKFRVIAYKTGDGSYQTYQDYTIGQPSLSLTLDTGVAYTIVAYSYGTSSLPPITPGETSAIGSAQIAYDNTNRDLMYVKQPYTPSSSNTTLNLTLIHQLMQITTSVTTNIGALNSISNAVIAPNFSDGSFPLNTGVMAGRTTGANQSIDFTGNNFPVAVNTPANATPVLINSNTTGSTASFTADVNIGGTTKTVNLANSFDITPGTQAVLGVQISKCGAWMDAGHTQWKEFMCQNLGATGGINPFSPEAGNHGAKYQWGSTGLAAEQGTRWISQATDQNTPGTLSGWLTTSNKPANAWNNGTEAAPVKSANDPCNVGYRIPTKTELAGLIANNTVDRTGSWTNSTTNYTTALYFKNPEGLRTLMFPIAGYRERAGGSPITNRGEYGYYWTGTYDGTTTPNASYYSMFISNAAVALQGNGGYPEYGFSVRCIAE